MTRSSFPFDDAAEAVAIERRLWVAIGVSLVFHALLIATLRGVRPTVYSFEAGAGNLPALQALIVGAPLQSEPEEPPPPQPSPPAIDPDLVAPPEKNPVETTFGRTNPPQAALAGGKPSNAAPGAPNINVSVGTIADPAQLGTDYVEQIAQRFPNRVQRPPVLLGAPVVDYPRLAIEKGLAGRFAAIVSLDALGKVADAKLVVDDPLFGPALLEAIKRMEFAPAQEGGSPVPYWAIIEVVFSLGQPATPPIAAQAPTRRASIFPRQPNAGR